MAVKTFAFPDGEGNLYIDFVGSGSETITLTADSNEGLDRSLDITFKAANCDDVVRTVKQEGMREEFTEDDFLLSDDTTFDVVKQKFINN